jgi:hypothetical protein
MMSRLGVVKVLDEGAGQIEDHAALALGSCFRDHVGDRDGLAHAGRADEHRVALLEPPGIGDRGEVRWPIGKDPGDSRGRLSRHFQPSAVELTGALAPVVGGQIPRRAREA